MPGRTCTHMKKRPIGLPLRSRPRRCSIRSGSSSNVSCLVRAPRRRFFCCCWSCGRRSGWATTSLAGRFRRRDALRFDVPAPGGGLPASPRSDVGGAGRVSPIWGLRTSALSAASTDIARPSRIGSGNSSGCASTGGVGTVASGHVAARRATPCRRSRAGDRCVVITIAIDRDRRSRHRRRCRPMLPDRCPCGGADPHANRVGGGVAPRRRRPSVMRFRRRRSPGDRRRGCPGARCRAARQQHHPSRCSCRP